MSVETIRSTIGYGSSPEKRPTNDLYITPPNAVESLLKVEKFQNPVLEPACGTGTISEVLKSHGYSVRSWDLYDYGYGIAGRDFLSFRPEVDDDWFPSVITNPPYSHAEEFVSKALEITELAEGKVALLLRLSFLEGQKRKKMFENSPLKAVYVFSKRVTFSRPDDKRDSGGMMAYSWYVWDWMYDGKPSIGWI